MNVHDFTVKDAKGEDVSLDNYDGRVLLIVNTASKCGFTPQYKGLEDLHKEFEGEGLTVLGFPCNQFGHQEPGTDDEIQQFCSINYGVSFPVMGKIDVNGKNADPLYDFLKKEKGGVLGGAIKWNFTKFLVGRDGEVINRYAPNDTPESLDGDIKAALKA